MEIVDRYLALGLRLGRHVDGLVDSYYGPPDLAAAVEQEEPWEPAALAAAADALRADLEEAELEEHRRGWLLDQAVGLRTYAGALAGEQLGYLDEVEGCYGVRPERIPEDDFAVAHDRLDELLPGRGTLEERYEAWRTTSLVPAERILEVSEPILAVLRERTAALVDLPDEEFTVELVDSEPWAAFNYYLGGGRSRIVVNTDLPFAAMDLVHLVAHEGYPGHHTERVVKERRLVEALGLVEESIQLVPTPQSLVGEGIAEVGSELLVDDEVEAELVRIFERAGVRCDPDETRLVREAREPLRCVTRNAAIMIHDEGLAEDDARAYVARWALAPAYRAERMVSFVVDPTWRAYVTTYSEGLRLCRAFVGADPASFRHLLTEPIRVGELLAAAGGDAAVSSGS
jgi:hypothetical protein